MRTLWAILGAVVLAAALFLLWPRAAPDAPRESSPPAPAPAAPPAPASPPAPATPPATTTPPAPAPPSATTAPPATPAPAPAPPATQPAVIERRPDGSLLVDHRFTLLGSGSQQDPYRVTWELLGSAAETYDPARKHAYLPDRVMRLSGAWVQLSGYFASALQKEETSELLVMFNRWDGCCIGLPPTPFDSVEATLAAPISLRGQHLIRYGTIRGRLQVDPFTAGPILLGLYRLEDAAVEGEPSLR